MLRTYELKEICQESLKKGEDLTKGLIAVLKDRDITAGAISGIGAVSKARLGYFNARTKKYEERIFEESLEIVSLKGNVSYKDGEIFPHLHAVLSRRDFSAFGGHLFHDTLVYAFEFEIIAFTGASFKRGFDEDTGLFLWTE